LISLYCSLLSQAPPDIIDKFYRFQMPEDGILASSARLVDTPRSSAAGDIVGTTQLSWRQQNAAFVFIISHGRIHEAALTHLGPASVHAGTLSEWRKAQEPIFSR